MKIRALTVCLAAFAAVAALNLVSTAQVETPEVFNCNAIMTAAPGSPPTTRLTITIEEYTSDEDTLKYLEILKAEGQAGVRKALEKIEKGWIVPRGQLREPVNFARSLDVEGGRVINILKVRYLRFLEFALGTPRSRDYDMTFIQLKIDENGEGEGYMFAGTRLFINEEERLVMEQRGTVPVKLSGVRLRK